MNEDKKIYNYLENRQKQFRKKSIKKLFEIIPHMKKGDTVTVFSTRGSIEWVKKQKNMSNLNVRCADNMFYRANWNDWRTYKISYK